MKAVTGFVMLFGLVLAGCDRLDPEERRKALQLPPRGFVGDPGQGIGFFNQYCMTCHGAQGQGSLQGPPLVDKVYRPGHHADLAFHIAVRDGVKSHHWSFGDMTPVPDITPEETAHIIAYIRDEQRRNGIR